MHSHNYYEILGCTKESSHEDIKHAYHNLALQFHPDKSVTPNKNSKKFQSVLKAWQVLGEPELRREYDAACRQEELDFQCNLVHARISAQELHASDEKRLYYPCRCGNNYYIERKHIEERNITVHIPCEECTFEIVVDT